MAKGCVEAQREVCRRSRMSGFTLIELVMVTIVIVILASIAIPQIISLVDAYRLRVAAEEVSETLNVARAQATEVNRRVTVAFVGGSNRFGFDTNTLPDGAPNPDGVPDDIRVMPNGVTFVAATNPPCSQPPGGNGSATIAFGSRGDLFLTAPGAPLNSSDCVKVQNRRGSMIIWVSLRGRVTVQ